MPRYKTDLKTYHKRENAQEVLTNQQLMFVNYYVGECCCNASEAAMKAGYKHPSSGYSVSNIPKVKALIAARMEECHLSSNRTLALLARKAEAAVGDYLTIEEWIDDQGNEHRGIALDLNKINDPRLKFGIAEIDLKNKKLKLSSDMALGHLVRILKLVEPAATDNQYKLKNEFSDMSNEDLEALVDNRLALPTKVRDAVIATAKAGVEDVPEG